jgi:GNAT superfamily N-acetyltransferase
MVVPFIRQRGNRPDTEDVAPLQRTYGVAVSARLGQLVVRPARYGDLRITSRTHVNLLPTGLFPSLGARFVRRWQRTFLDSPYGVGYVVIDSTAPRDGIVGFLLGTTDQAGHMAALLTNRRTMASLAMAGVWALVRRPQAAIRLMRSRVWPWARRLFLGRPAGPVPTGSASSPQVAVVAALAVHPEWRGSGIGARLVTRFVQHARLAGATVAELVTPTGSTGATGFYERLGWEAGPHHRTRDGDDLRTYRCSLSNACWS